MNLVTWIYFATGLIVACFFGLLAVASCNERAVRAAIISTALFVVSVLIWFGGYAILHPSNTLLLCAVGLVLLVAVLFFVPLGSAKSIHIGRITERVDERDIAFAREEYLPGTKKHEAYYALRPELRDVDERIRSLPERLSPGTRFYDPVKTPQIAACFRETHELTRQVDGPVSRRRREVDPAEAAAEVKAIVRRLGADDVGIAPLNPAFVYTHVGRGPEEWGLPIRNNHQFVIAFALEMDYAQVAEAPDLPITEETARQYLRGARLSIELAEQIRDWGYPARAHIAGSNYQVMLPPVAHDAGLGELGRMGYLISPRLGGRLRLGAVTTDLPMLPDQPIRFGVHDFCEKCLKCALNCPSRAIPLGNRSTVRGVEKWQLDIERCLSYWRQIGTDCGLCMKVCPFSHPPTLIHDLIRTGIRRSVIARRVAVWGDDLLYGRRVRTGG